jgi:hypothetical protein
VIPCDSEYSLIFCNFGIQIYQGIRKVFMVICAICMCANGTIVTDIFVGTVYLAFESITYLCRGGTIPQSTKPYCSMNNKLFSGSPKKG